MKGLTGLHDRSRRVLAMTGNDATAVLQGVVSNDLDKLEPGRALYAALLTPQGKYLFDFFLLKRPGSGAEGEEPAILIDVAADRADALALKLKMYCLRRDAAISGETDLEVALVWPIDPDGSVADAPRDGIPDPRDPALGWRIYGSDAATLLEGAGATVADGDALTALRVHRQIPQTGLELVPDETYILEAGFERLNGVDFRKGCYVGQEVTARMKHKTELRKRLVPVIVEGTPPPPGTQVVKGGKPVGTLFSTADGRGLAHLRLDRCDGPLDAGEARITLAT